MFVKFFELVSCFAGLGFSQEEAGTCGEREGKA